MLADVAVPSEQRLISQASVSHNQTVEGVTSPYLLNGDPDDFQMRSPARLKAQLRGKVGKDGRGSYAKSADLVQELQLKLYHR